MLRSTIEVMNKVYAYLQIRNFLLRRYSMIMRIIVNENKRVQNALQVKDEKVDTSSSIQHTNYHCQW